MAIEVWQTQPESGEDAEAFEDKSSSITYCVTGTDDLGQASAAVLAVIPPTYFGMTLDRIPHRKDPNAADIWFFTARYTGRVKPIQEPTADPIAGGIIPVHGDARDWTFRIGADGQRQLWTCLNDNVYPATDPPDFKNVIGLNKADELPTGMMIDEPVFAWTEPVRWPLTSITRTYLTRLAELQGSVNDAPFKGFREKSVMFLEASGGPTSEGWFNIDYSFVAKPVRTNYLVGTGADAINVPEKLGFQVEEAAFDFIEDTDTRQILPRVRYVRIMDVYLDKDFSLIGIGV